ncbi:MAG: histidine kinase, partial [Clostridia bacterium]|nr:histidine kinase [Clostridia bacterium]
LAAPVPRPDGVWVVQAAKSIAETDAALRRLRQVLILGGLAALALGGVAGYLLAGRALAPIRDAFRRQREFVADASHELRTPLAVLRGSVEVLGRDLQAGRVPPDAAALVRDALTEADRLGRLVDDLLTLAQADAEGIALRFDAVDLAALVREACRGMDRLAEARDVALRVRAEAPVWVRGDPERLLQLVRILVDNAIRYNRPGGSVEVSVAPVDRSRSRQTELLVADTGPGMPPETLARAFDRFYRGDRARAQGEGGSGLGLAIARSIAAAHGGRVEIESQVGAGTRVRVLLPLAEASSF